ncbi:MAG TPA: hypothetical protein VL021_09725 [Brumimicrobium sp.]|nr:hypothetical protein [Brumimicrobium sp.]
MKIKYSIYSLFLVGFLFLTSCKKEEQSCHDGIFDPEKEEKTDCGGVCPPCDFVPTAVDEFVQVKVNGKFVSFTDYTLTKNPNWNLRFKNDSLDIRLNLTEGDSLGGRPIEQAQSTSTYAFKDYPTLYSGMVVLSDINHVENELSGYFQAKFVANNGFDTLFLTNGEFAKIPW